MNKSKLLLASIALILFAVVFLYKISDYEQTQIHLDGAYSKSNSDRSTESKRNENDPYVGQIRKHNCSKASAIEVDKILKYLNSDLDYSEKTLTRILSNDRDCVLAIHTLGTVYSFKKQYDKALDYYEEALTLAPNGAVIYQSIGTVRRN